MTNTAIKEQIAAIQIATAKATKSPSAALKFLKDSGIIEHLSKAKKSNSSPKRAIRKKK